MKTLIHTDKEQIESIIRYTHGQGTDRIDYPPERCLLCGHGGYRWNALCITDEFRL